MTITQAIAATALPLVPHLPAICKALEENGSVVLRADPGSGKSTLVPLALLEHFGGKILMLEPRRAAVLGITSRLAELLGEDMGERAGYAVRLERKVSAKTQIEVVTEGLLVRRLQENPSMLENGSGSLAEPWTIIFDEFHERSIHTDLAFAFVLDLRRMGANIRLVIMSATMDVAQAETCIAQNGGKAAIMECPGKVFPVALRYRPLPEKASLDKECAAALAAILTEELTSISNDILVFLPGRREIAACAAHLKERGLDRDFDIAILHGSLPLAQQRTIIAPPKEHTRRVILSTNVAETGLTIPGIGMVVDSGYARIQRFHIPSGMNRLSLESISGNSAEQRAGRAGRLGPGRCVCLWAQTEQRPQETPAEITRIDITAAVLESLLWGVTDADGLPWLEPPPAAAWSHAIELLQELGAIDSRSRPTETGKQIARLGLDPRLGRLCIAGKDAGKPALACAAAALLAERDDSGFHNDADFTLRLANLRTNFARRVRDSAEDLLRRLGLQAPLQWSVTDEAQIGEIVVAAFPDRVAKRQDMSGSGIAAAAVAVYATEGIFRFPSGREAKLNVPLAHWICALEVDSGERMGHIRLAIPLAEETALAALATKLVTEQTVEWNTLHPRLIETTKAGHIVLSAKQKPCSRAALLPFLTPMLREQGLTVLPWDESKDAAQHLLERIRFFVNRKNCGVNHWNDELLINDAAVWLGPFVWNGKDSGRGDIIDAEGLCSALTNRLGWEHKREMDKQVPDHYTVPNGRKRPIDYSSGEPVIRIRLQETFGISGSQTVMGHPIVFHLLSPADRPIQITRDLDGFWTGSYAAVRKEMRGRYPKHKWPENPAFKE